MAVLREYDRWAKAHPSKAKEMGGFVFFRYLEKERPDLLDFRGRRQQMANHSPLASSWRSIGRLTPPVALAREKAMADWKKLTSPSGDGVYLNLDTMIGMQRNPDINITFLQSVSDPRVNIEVRETPDEILSASST